MRVIVELLGRAWLLELHTARTAEGGEPDEALGHDPHSTTGAHIERGPGASEYATDVEAGKFGFRASPPSNPNPDLTGYRHGG